MTGRRDTGKKKSCIEQLVQRRQAFDKKEGGGGVSNTLRVPTASDTRWREGSGRNRVLIMNITGKMGVP